MIFDMVIYVTLINLTEWNVFYYYYKRDVYFFFICFRIFNFGQIKMIFRGDENLKLKVFIADVNVYRFSS